MNIQKMKELIDKLSQASRAYYDEDKPIMSDKQYDALYDELAALENSTGIIMAGSPTQKVQGSVSEAFEKVRHSEPMLSAQKTKDVNEVVSFAGGREVNVSWKLDGLTLVLIYDGGTLQKALTRGNGEFGEDVTANARMISNIPLTIPYKERVELRGECLISWKAFDEVNTDGEYSAARNLAAGSIRQLDPMVTKSRKLSFIPFKLISPARTTKSEDLKWLASLGFDVVENINAASNLKEVIKQFAPEKYDYPVDGVIIEYNVNCASLSIFDFSGVESIDDGAFAESGLQEVNLPHNIQEVGELAFRECKLLKTFHWNAQIKNIPQYCFYNCLSLSTFDFSSVESIHEGAFAGSRLQEANLFHNIQKVEPFAFQDCKSLVKVEWLSDESINIYTFANCENLKSVNISDQVQNIEANAFQGCPNAEFSFI